jgi:hypothetical protein
MVKPCLVDARHMKNVPGRVRMGTSAGGFRICILWDAVCAVRALTRHRNDLVQRASQHILHVHKSLTQRNLQIHHGLCDLNGRRDVDRGRDCRRTGCRRVGQAAPSAHQASAETIRKSLVGNGAPSICSRLKRSRDWYRAPAADCGL